MTQLKTRDRSKPFSYSRDVDGTLRITFGSGYKSKLTLAQFAVMLAKFRGRTVPLGTSRHAPIAGSLGQWLRANVSPTALASYVGPILVPEQHATWADSPDRALRLTFIT